MESQQADREAAGGSARTMSAEEAAATARRRTIELSIARARADLASATHPAHRQMLETAIAALTEQLR